MSLVICSNLDSDAVSSETTQNIHKPFSFRNGLSSTYTIPKDGQVALQSCKYNLDGSVPISTGSHVLYQYYGEDMADGDKIADKSSAVPIRCDIFDGADDGIVEVSVEEIASKLSTAMNGGIYHPQLRDLVTTSVDRDATSNEFKGYIINYGYYDSSNSTIPTASQIENQANVNAVVDFEWDGEAFSSLEATSSDPCVGLLSGKPLSLHNGSFEVDFSDPNSVDLEWSVGLSRWVNSFSGHTGDRHPSYWKADSRAGDDDLFFYDYLVARVGDVLKVFHACGDTSVDGTQIMGRALVYGQDDVALNYNLNTNTAGYTSVRFTASGQRIKIELTADGVTYDVLYSYDATLPNTQNLSCIHQSRWSMYPILHLENSETTFGNSLTVTQYTEAANISNTDILSLTNSWFNSVELTPSEEGLAREIELRPWNDYSNASKWAEKYFTWADILTGANMVIDLENYLIMKPSKTFTPSLGANTEGLLGFDKESPTNNYDYGAGSLSTQRTFTSSSVPKLIASRSMFVRLDNFTQSSLNARMGNRSQIIAHLPRFDGQVETGRIYHEPKNLIFLDLNNSQPMNLSSFDISFVYSNEQYCRSLTGQSVVCLYIRERPKVTIDQI